MSYRLADIAELLEGEVRGDDEACVSGVASIASAKAGEITFLVSGKYKKYLEGTKATAVILAQEYADECRVNAIVVKNPEAAFAQWVEYSTQRRRPATGVHATAVLGEDCDIHSSVSIGANCVLGDRVKIAANTIIHPGVVIQSDCHIGESCEIRSNVTLCHDVRIGNRVVIHAGAVIGEDGFGFVSDDGVWKNIPQVGSVVIEDDVQIGANTTIDRGALDNTYIAKGVKIDNLVQVAHNVQIGENTIIAGCVGIAGSARIGKHCMIGGASSINGHIEVADGVMLAGTATVFKSLTEPGIYASGINVEPHIQWGRTIVRLKQIDQMAKRIKKLESHCYDDNE